MRKKPDNYYLVRYREELKVLKKEYQIDEYNKRLQGLKDFFGFKDTPEPDGKDGGQDA